MNLSKNKASAFWSVHSTMRTFCLALLLLWFLSTVWGWFFVGPDVLRDNHTARDIVTRATDFFPWLGNIRKLGPQAEKAVFLHSVLFFVAAVCSFVVGCGMELTPEQLRTTAGRSKLFFLMRAIAGVVLMIAGASIYGTLGASEFGLSSGQKLVFVNAVTLPAFAPWPGAMVGGGLATLVASLMLAIRKFNNIGSKA
jgi:hypothetical protein